jgi:NTP pyrophosphatase (non-canonical NTP hydrolase)
MSDRITTVEQLRAMVRQFVDDRDWQQFHSPKNLSMAMSIEAAELMEHFQWLTIEESRTLRHDATRLHAVTEELADVVCYALALANELDVDLTEAIQAKMRKNEAKYPVESYRGRYGPEDLGG